MSHGLYSNIGAFIAMGVRGCVSVVEVAVVVVGVVVAVGVATGGRIVCVPGRASQSTMWQRLSRCPAS